MNSQIPNVAILTDWIGPFQKTVLTALQDTLNAAGISTLTYVGRELHHPHPVYGNSNHIYSLIRPENHLGVFVLTSTLGNHSTDEELMAFLKPFEHLPVVGFGRSLPGIPGVRLSNARGMEELMEHLILNRGFQKFVFMQGTQDHPESIERERVFRAALQRHGLSFDENHCISGGFYPPTARRSMMEFLKTEAHDFECVVCASDDMALAVMGVLEEQGLRVPQDVAVVGFDDIEMGQYASSPLTSVRQPTAEMGRAAAHMLLEMMQGRHVQDMLMPSHLVVRESCGSGLGFRNPLQAQPGLDPEDLLFEAFQTDLKGKPGSFLPLWRSTLEKVRIAAELEHHQDLLMGWSDHLMPTTPHQQREILRLGLQASQLVSERLLRLETRHTVGQLQFVRHLSHVGTSMGGHDTLEGLLEEFKHSLPSIGLSHFMLVLYESFGRHPGEWMKVHLSSTGTGQEGEVLHSRDLPGHLLQAGMALNWQVHPIYVNDEHYGCFMMVEPPDWGGDEELLRYLVTRSIHHMVKTQALIQHSEDLELQVKERTRQLQEANQELRRSLLLDGLTRVYNRSAFDDYLSRTWKDHQRSGQCLSLIMCDVDFFKKYNDAWGHLKGDDCLRAVSQALSQAAYRPGDMVARYGGEEFVVVLPETGAEGAKRVAERIQEAVADLRIPHPGSEVSAFVTLSMGIKSHVPLQGEEPTQMVHEADQGLYRSKRFRRNCITVM